MDNMDDKLYWHNYKTGELEYIETPSDFTDYISQQDAAQNMYKAYLKLGKEPIEAAIKVLTACIGDKTA